jgi:amidohydrolase
VSTDPFLRALLAALDDEIPGAMELRRRLHAQPETSHQEVLTARAIAEALDDERCDTVGGGSVMLRLGHGPAIFLRAEMDALPIREQTGVSFASNTGAMHACGHDVHMAALVAVLRATRRFEERLPVPMTGLFQHSEEAYPSGALEVRESGVLEEARAVIAAHVRPDVPQGSVAATPGFVNAAADSFMISVQGSAGHAGYPHEANDAVLTLAHIVVSVQQIVSRRIDPTQGGVMTVAWLRAGAADNTISERAEAGGTIRASDEKARALMRKYLKEVVENTAIACGCTAWVHFTEGEPVLFNDPDLVKEAQGILKQVGFGAAPDTRSFGADDFGYYCDLLPCLMLFVGTRGASPKANKPLHHPRFLPPDDAVRAVARSLLAGYLGAARSSAILDAAAFRGRSYRLGRYVEDTGGQQNEDISAP